MSEAPHWEQLATFGTMFEAELARATLETAGIACLVQSHSGTGVFGAGFQGAIPGGVTVLVPSPELERARELVDDGSG